MQAFRFDSSEWKNMIWLRRVSKASVGLSQLGSEDLSVGQCFAYIIGFHIEFARELERIMGDSSASYIHMVQHLIEKCLIFRMSKEKCMEALSKHANIMPVITSTVWNELEKENKEFFDAYAQSQSKEDRMSQEETSQMVQNMISGSSKSQSQNSDKD